MKPINGGDWFFLSFMATSMLIDARDLYMGAVLGCDVAQRWVVWFCLLMFIIATKKAPKS